MNGTCSSSAVSRTVLRGNPEFSATGALVRFDWSATNSSSTHSNRSVVISDKKYRLKKPLEIVRTMDGEQFTSFYNPLNISGSGATSEEADKDLEGYLLDLFDGLSEKPDEKLGKRLLKDKQHLLDIIRKVK